MNTYQKPSALCQLGLIALCVWFAPVVHAKKLSADPFSVNWILEHNEYRCSLEQAIPEFGTIVFSKSPSTELRLEIHSRVPFYRRNETPLKARPPSWRSDLNGYSIARRSKVSDDERLAFFDESASVKAYKALQNGYALQLSLLHGKPVEKLLIVVEGLGFSPLLASFDTCKQESKQLLVADTLQRELEENAAEVLAQSMAKLNNDSPKVAALTEGEMESKLTPLQRRLQNLPDFYRIPFEKGDTELSGSSAKILDQLLRRWQLRGMPEQIRLHGHADDATESTASYINSDMRTQAVARYLVSKMPDLKLKIEAHGDTIPLEKISSQRVDILPSDLPKWE